MRRFVTVVALAVVACSYAFAQGSGTITIEYKDGSKYQGELANGKPNGKGQ